MSAARPLRLRSGPPEPRPAGLAERPAGAAGTLLAFIGEDDALAGWRLLSGGAIIGRGDDLAELPEQRPWVRTILAVPGSAVAMHWLELEGEPTLAQAAAAARLKLADAIAGPLDAMHFAAGRREQGLTAVATVPAVRMQAWLDRAREAGIDPVLVVPAPLLLLAPGEGVVRYAGSGALADYRGSAIAFSVEEALAGLLLGDARIVEIDEAVRDAGLAPALAAPVVNLRQGAFAPRRERQISRTSLRRLGALITILVVASLAIEITAILRTVAAADRAEDEARELRAALGNAPVAGAGGGFGTLAGALFGAIRDTPNAEVTRLTYRADNSLTAALLADSQATIDGIRARIEGRGVQASGGLPTNVSGRAAGELTLRPRR